MENPNCVLCGTTNSDRGVLRKVSRGLSTLRQACALRNEDALARLNAENVHVHDDCRIQITRHLPSTSSAETSHPPSGTPEPAPRVLHHRSAQQNFDFLQDCVLCSERISAFLASDTVNFISDQSTKQGLLSACDTRDDDWGHMVRTRIINESNLSKVGARYHRTCYKAFVNPRVKRELVVSPSLHSSAADRSSPASTTFGKP